MPDEDLNQILLRLLADSSTSSTVMGESYVYRLGYRQAIEDVARELGIEPAPS